MGSKKSKDQRLSKLNIKDEHLRDVLNGQAFLVQDGAMGTMLQAAGLAGKLRIADLLCLSQPSAITAIHKQYVDAGAQLVLTNTFNSNARKLGTDASVADVYQAAAACVRAAGARYIAGDIGPTGELLKPFGSLSFEDAYALFAEQAKAADAAGCDVIVIETMSNLLEAKVALLAARENTSLPVFVTMTFEEDGRTFLGTSPAVAAAALSAMGADAVGINCSLGPAEMAPLVKSFAKHSRCPIDVRPNAGLPRIDDDQTVFDLSAADFAASLPSLIESGATILGSCCGSNPDFTRKIAKAVKSAGEPKPRQINRFFTVTSAQKLVSCEGPGAHNISVIGERINPTGNRKVRDALSNADYDLLVGLASAQQQAGADILDVNVGMPELDEASVMRNVVTRLQSAVTAPLCIDSSDTDALKQAVRIYAGKPLVNSVSGKTESLLSVLPIVAKYGCAVIGLTLDDDGIPTTAEKRLEIAKRIVEHASSFGIPREDIVIDCLTMPASTSPGQPVEILRAIHMIKCELGVATTLGVSNASFGLPNRSLMNAAFLANALGAGLDLPIIDPNKAQYKDVIVSYKALTGQDPSCADYIGRFSVKPVSDEQRLEKGHHKDQSDARRMDSAGKKASPPHDKSADAPAASDALRHAILIGSKTDASESVQVLLQEQDGITLINDILVPSLDEVGASFENGDIFLPQLLSSAEAAKAAFDVIRSSMSAYSGSSTGGAIIVATVKGDIHDIGKNIVKMLLENYGYKVIDLGKDVSSEEIASAAEVHNAKLVGLSALMTTTVQSMKDAISLLRQRVPQTKVMVGGAVVTGHLADQLGADFYAKDAVESTRIAEIVFGG